MKSVAASRLDKARKSLDAARACLAQGAWDDAVNRAGQAALMAARAALSARGEEVETAAAAAEALARLPGLPADAADALSNLHDEAVVADRADHPAFEEDEAVGWVEVAERLVGALARSVPGGEG